ncbi:MAG: AbrB/MazE/SpoVT family DNA-binding domain-containing protein [Thermoplasmata archaeon]|nr:AbrB/MazE/SpoVT family DNA-binding domain-containing protein [Thermoplasmata archaeon]
MDTAIIKVSSKGQIVIPATWRKRMRITTGEELLAIGEDDMLVLKKLSPLKKDFEEVMEPIRKKIARLGITRKDVSKAIEKVRSESRDG